MRRMRARAHAVGLAAIGATVLVAPLLISAPADARLIPKADLSIVKTVASHGPTIELNPTRSGTKENGHLEWVSNGLRIYTEMDFDSCVFPVLPPATTCNYQLEAPETVVTEYIDTLTPLSEVVIANPPPNTPAEPYLHFVPDQNSQGFIPTFNILVQTGFGTEIRLQRAMFGVDWAGYYTHDGSPANMLSAGTTNVGTLSGWVSALTPNPQLYPNVPQPMVTAFGFSIPGPGIVVGGVVERINFAGEWYELGRSFEPSIGAAPGETVTYQLLVTNAGGQNSKAAQEVQVADVLPPEMTAIPDTLHDQGWGCALSDNMLTCPATTFAIGSARIVTFDAQLDESISTTGQPQTEGHWVGVESDDATSSIPAGQTRTTTVACPEGYLATDGGLLLDQAGASADVVVETSTATIVGNTRGWTVRATNLGDTLALVTTEVTCLADEVGSSGGHTHALSASTLPMQQKILPASPASDGYQVQRSCPVGYTPVAPGFETTSGIAVIRESYAIDNIWYWVVDHTDGTDASFGVTCLAPRTLHGSGHTAQLVISVPDDTISIASETQTEGIMACPDNSFAIVGGYGGYSSRVRSLGAEPRGDRYMFRFYNEEDTSKNADIQVTCVGALTANEPTYKDVINTAYVTTTTKDRSSTDNSSSAGVAVSGIPAPSHPSGVTMSPLTATRTVANNKTTALTFTMSCPKSKPCNFTVKAFSGTNLVASKTTSLIAQAANKPVTVPTTNIGKNLAFGDSIVVKIKTTAGTTTYNVGIVS